MDANHELTQAVCPICGFNQRNIDFTEECEKCHAKKFLFGWYLLKNEIWTIRIIMILIALAIISSAIIFFWMKAEIIELEAIISTKSIQSLIASIYQEWAW